MREWLLVLSPPKGPAGYHSVSFFNALALSQAPPPVKRDKDNLLNEELRRLVNRFFPSTSAIRSTRCSISSWGGR